MGLPIGVALFGVGIGVGSIQLLSNVITIPSFATQLGAMIGLGVGIDYALFIVTRYREGTRAGLEPEHATEVAIDTAGRAVVFAGFTVVISLLGMFVMNLSFINGLATGAALTVAVTMIASVTLLPALLGFAQGRVETTRWRGLIMAGGAAFAFLGVGIGFPMLGAVGFVVGHRHADPLVLHPGPPRCTARHARRSRSATRGRTGGAGSCRSVRGRWRSASASSCS